MVFFQLRLSEGNQFINSGVILLFKPYSQLKTEEYMYFWDFSLLYTKNNTESFRTETFICPSLDCTSVDKYIPAGSHWKDTT